MFKRLAILPGVVLACSLVAAAQEVRSEVTVSAIGVFNYDSNSTFVQHRATDSAGVLAGYRYNINHWAAVEANYGWNRNSQEYFTVGGFNRIQSDVNQVTADFVARTPTFGHFRPYVLAGGGAFIYDPVQRFVGLTDASGARTVTRIPTRGQGTFVYGGGADIDLTTRGSRLSGVSLRLGYRGYAYQVPDFGFRRLDVNSWTHTAQPEAGLTFRF
jgi:Outer membrane protein beta-barrel domain